MKTKKKAFKKLKKPGPKKKHAGGRPTVMTQNCLNKLEEAFLMGCTDIEACLHANIVDGTLYKYQREHPEFIKRKEALKENLVLKARTTIKDNIEEPGTARWYLERKKKDEFGQSVAVDASDNIMSVLSEIAGKEGGEK